jgi:hypothetical protein
MSHTTKSVCELLPPEGHDLYAQSPDPVGSGPQRAEARPESRSRTSLKQYILDPVLPVLTLLSMSALTVVMLVVIVTTVADMDTQLPGGYVSLDPWAGWNNGSSGSLYQDRDAYADLTASLEPAEDRELALGAPLGDPF